jgi:hypothetical protein
MLSDGSSTFAALAFAVAAEAASADPSGVAGWLPSAVALGGPPPCVATCGREFGVNHTRICGDVG